MSLRFGAVGATAISLLVVVSCLGAINGTLFTGARVYYALGTVTLGLVVGFGLYPRGFERLVIFTGPFYWGFIGLVGVALLVLRSRGLTAKSKYHVPLFPLTPLVFAASSGAMVYAGVAFAIEKRSVEAWWAVAVVVSGLVVGWIDWRARRR
jgi:hypothetical protein